MRTQIVVIFSALTMAAVEFGVPVGSVAFAQASLIRKPAQEVIEAIAEYLTKKGGRELAEELAEFGGEATVRRVAERAVREGGDDALDAFVRIAQAHGPDAVRAVDNAVNVPRLLRAVDDLPEDVAAQALRRLGAGADGRALAEVVETFGSRALRAEVRHPGIGGQLVATLGDDGATLATRVSRDQAITISRHADDIAKLPESQRAQLMKLLRENTDRMVTFMGRFIEKNPGNVLFTVAATSVVLAHADKILGGEGQIVQGPDGEPVYVPNPGMVERIVSPAVRQILTVLLPLIAIAGCIWLAIKLWFYYQFTKLKHDVAVTKLSQEVAKRSDEANVTKDSEDGGKT
jgi:hypothetical protein